jgi:hypothetical protein
MSYVLGAAVGIAAAKASGGRFLLGLLYVFGGMATIFLSVLFLVILLRICCG